jgi:hypothetical protein
MDSTNDTDVEKATAGIPSNIDTDDVSRTATAEAAKPRASNPSGVKISEQEGDALFTNTWTNMVRLDKKGLWSLRVPHKQAVALRAVWKEENDRLVNFNRAYNMLLRQELHNMMERFDPAATASREHARQISLKMAELGRNAPLIPACDCAYGVIVADQPRSIFACS